MHVLEKHSPCNQIFRKKDIRLILETDKLLSQTTFRKLDFRNNTSSVKSTYSNIEISKFCCYFVFPSFFHWEVVSMNSCIQRT